MEQRRPRILLAVTADVSLVLMDGLPGFLASQGWEVHVVSSPGKRLDGLRKDPAIRVHAVAMNREISPFNDLTALFRWMRLVRAVRPDITLIGTPKAALLGGLAAYFARVPARVYHARGLRFETTAGLQRQVLRVIERVTIAVSHRVLAVSPSLRTVIIGEGLAPAHKVVVLGAGSSNGVDVEKYRPGSISASERRNLRRSAGLEEGVPVVGFVGRLTADKGLPVLAEACAILSAESVRLQLLVVGDVDDASGREALELLRRSGQRVLTTGSVAHPAAQYGLMDIFCLPSMREGFPNVVLEAGASALPTVTTDATGAVDSVVDGVTGLVVKKSDAHALAGALRVLVLDEQKRMAMGGQARRFVVDHFSRPLVWSLLESFLREQRSARREGSGD